MSDQLPANDPLGENVVSFVPFGFLAGLVHRTGRKQSSVEPLPSHLKRNGRPRASEQAEHFEKHALSWDSTGRNRKLLLHISDSLARARAVLKEHRAEPILSPLAQKFLELSIVKSRRRRLWGSVAFVAGAVAVLGISADAFFRDTQQLPENGRQNWSFLPAETEIVSNSGPQPDSSLSKIGDKPPTTGIETNSPGDRLPIEAPAPEQATLPEEPSNTILSSPEIQSAAPLPRSGNSESISAMVDQIEQKQAGGFREEVFTLLRRLFEISHDHENQSSPSLSSAEMRRLAIVVGKLSLINGDLPAGKVAWHLGYEDPDNPQDPQLPDRQEFEFRLLLARTASTAGRPEDAAAFLDCVDPAENEKSALLAMLRWTFDERELAIEEFRDLAASNPEFRKAETIAALDWLEETRSLLDDLRRNAVE